MACHTHDQDIPRNVAGGIVQLPPEMSIADLGITQILSWMVPPSLIVDQRHDR
jgi:hypothetical protein